MLLFTRASWVRLPLSTCLAPPHNASQRAVTYPSHRREAVTQESRISCKNDFTSLALHAGGAHEERVAQGRAEHGIAVEEQAQLGQDQSVQRGAAGAVDGDGDGRADVRIQPHFGRRGQRAVEAGAAQRAGRQQHVAGGAEAAFDVLPGGRLEDGAAADGADRAGQFIAMPAEVELHDRARGKAAQVVRVQHLQQRGGELGKVVVQPLGHAGGQQRRALDQPFDVGVFAGVAGQLEFVGDGGKAFGKGAHVAAQQRQLGLVMRHQLLHVPLRLGGVVMLALMLGRLFDVEQECRFDVGPGHNYSRYIMHHTAVERGTSYAYDPEY